MKPAPHPAYVAAGVVVALACLGLGVALVVSLLTPGPARLRVEPGVIPECEGPGYAVSGGRDWDRSGDLGDEEAETMAIVCAVDGQLEVPLEQEELDGAFDSTGEPRHGLQVFLGFEDEPHGAECGAGGLRVDVGVDGDRDGSLSRDEITQEQVLCHPLKQPEPTTSGPQFARFR